MIIFFEKLLLFLYIIMSSLNDIKQMKITQLMKLYNQQLNELTYNYNQAVKIIIIKRQPYSNVTKAVNEYNNKKKLLKTQLESNIQKLNNVITLNEIKPTNNKNALLIGINYVGTKNQLNGCINDVNNINKLITNSNFKNIKIMNDNTTIKPNRDNILNEFKNLLMNTNENDLCFFYYSGHGSYTIDKERKERTGYDQTIIPLDFNPIVDDELKLIINNNLKRGATLISMFDSCNSGSVLDLKYQWLDSYNNNMLTENINENENVGNVIMISGCLDSQESSDDKIDNLDQGAMTWAFLQSYKKNITWRQLLVKMREHLNKSKYSQIPQLSTSNFFNIDSKIDCF